MINTLPPSNIFALITSTVDRELYGAGAKKGTGEALRDLAAYQTTLRGTTSLMSASTTDPELRSNARPTLVDERQVDPARTQMEQKDTR